jgi:hypothetical protein
MIDPITAFATAQAAIKGIQAAIKMGKDIHAMSGDIMKLFDARNEVAVAAVREKQQKTSALTQATDTVLKAHALAESIRELKEHFIYNVRGGGDLWEAIVAEHNAIVLQRRKELREAIALKEQKRKDMVEVLNALFYGFVALLVSSGVIWGCVEYIKYMQRR